VKGVLLAGGTGTRLRPYSGFMPKQLLPVNGKPCLLYGIEQMRDAGITDIAVILGDNHPGMIRAQLGDGSRYRVKVTYIIQGPARGVAHAIGLAAKYVGDEPFCVYLGDVILKDDLKPLVEEFERHDQYGGMVLLCPTQEPWRYGIANLDDAGNLTRLIEKPEDGSSNLALVGVYFFRRAIFPVIERLQPSPRGELEITDAIWELLQLKVGDQSVEARLVSGWFKGWYRGIDSKEDLEEANNGA